MTESEKEQREMELDFHGLIKILAENLYNKKDTFIRELIQNSHDACWRRHHKDSEFSVEQAAIDILPDLTGDPGKIVFRDNGEGMSRDDVINFLSAIGRSGTREARDQAPEAIGQFGIGFLSGFVIGGRIELRTRRYDAPAEDGVYWVSSGDRQYQIARTKVERVGTEVSVFLKSTKDRGYVSEEAIKIAVRQYADLLKIPIFVNDPYHTGTPVNTRIMPWERMGLSKLEVDFENKLYLERNVPDNVLEAIPIQEADLAGLLYITKTRVVGIDPPRTVRVFIKRMYLCDGAEDLLPPWAGFVNGIINTSALEPNAARDNFMKEDGKAETVRERLGNIIISHLDQLKFRNPELLSQILLYHDLAIKAACYYHHEFYEKFFHLLEWRVNAGSPMLEGQAKPSDQPEFSLNQFAGRIRLPDLVDGERKRNGSGPVRISYFSSPASRSQFFQIADAAGATVVDTSQFFEEQLLQAWARNSDGNVQLVSMGQADDPSIFRSTTEDDDVVERLAKAMSRSIRPGGKVRLSVVARRIKPKDLSAILRDEEQSDGLRTAQHIVSDPNASADQKRVAQDLIRLSANQDMHLVVNAESPLVRGIAEFASNEQARDGGDISEDALELMLALYNSALLANHRMMSATNAAIFHKQFQRLMERILSSAQELARARRDLQRLITDAPEAQTRRLQPIAEREHVQGFFVTPYNEKFNVVRDAMRRFFQMDLHCELLEARHRTHDRSIAKNVEAHIRNADFFVIDLTGPNENVLIETGAIEYSRSDAPILFIGQAGKDGRVPLPADLQGTHVNPYAADGSAEDWRKAWIEACRADTGFGDILERAGRAQFVAPELVMELCGGVKPSEETAESIAKRYPTLKALAAADLDGIRTCLKSDEKPFAQGFHEQLTKNASVRLAG